MNFFLRRDLMDELVVYIREAVDRKQENVRRRRRRDALRLQLVKVLENMAANCTFGIRWVFQFFGTYVCWSALKTIVFKIISFFASIFHSSCVIERETMSLHPTFVEYIEGARLYLETETDKENTSIREVKKHFCDFIRIMIKSFSRKYTHTQHCPCAFFLLFVFACLAVFFRLKNAWKIIPFFYAFGFVCSEKFNKTPYAFNKYAWRSFVHDRRLWLIKVNCLCRAFLCWNVLCIGQDTGRRMRTP